MASFKLDLNVPYILSTYRDTLLNERIVITGIENYDKIQSLGYNVILTAIDEKIITPDGGDSPEATYDYFKNKLFYICEQINEAREKTGIIHVLWDEIIDEDRTNQLEAIYKYYARFTVNSQLDKSMDTVIQKINAFIINEFNTNIMPEFVKSDVVGIGNDKDAELSELQRQLNEAMAIVNKIASLKALESVIEALKDGKTADTLRSIKDQLDIILTTVTRISDITI